MNCLTCNADALIAAITMTFELPMAARSGSVKIGGTKITHFDFKEAWEKQAPLRGPIFCNECSAEHYWETGKGEGLKLGSVNEARARQP